MSNVRAQKVALPLATTFMNGVPTSKAGRARTLTGAFLGLLAAGVVPSVVLALMFPLGGQLNVSSFGITALSALPFSLLAGLLVGGPTFLVLLRAGLANWRLALVCGFAIGSSVFYVLGRAVAPSMAVYGAAGALAGAACLATWRLVTRVGAPPSPAHHP